MSANRIVSCSVCVEGLQRDEAGKLNNSITRCSSGASCASRNIDDPLEPVPGEKGTVLGQLDEGWSGLGMKHMGLMNSVGSGTDPVDAVATPLQHCQLTLSSQTRSRLAMAAGPYVSHCDTRKAAL